MNNKTSPTFNHGILAVADDTDDNDGDYDNCNGGNNGYNKIEVGEEVHDVRFCVVHGVVSFTKFAGRRQAS